MASNASSSSKASGSTRRSRRSRDPDQATTNNSGAAAEPEPSAAAPSARRAAAATTYNVRDYQNPDAGAADRPRSKAAKGKGATKTKGKKKDGAATFICFTCGKAAPKLLTCSQCHRAHYCDRECQRKDWPRHKKACRACVAAEAKRATRARKATAAARAAGGRAPNEICVICIGPVRSPVELPCGHAYCAQPCLAELRAKGVAQVCPLCREELPAGAEGLYDLAYRTNVRIEGMVERGEASWASLAAAEREEMDEVVAMWTEAAAQGHQQVSCHTQVNI